LLGEHRELHAIWSILTQKKKGYSRHPETQRWRGKLKALFLRHNDLVGEMIRRGYSHSSPLAEILASGHRRQNVFVHTYDEQIRILQEKGCDCAVGTEDLAQPMCCDTLPDNISERR
jgi:hypothetical protein